MVTDATGAWEEDQAAALEELLDPPFQHSPLFPATDGRTSPFTGVTHRDPMGVHRQDDVDCGDDCVDPACVNYWIHGDRTGVPAGITVTTGTTMGYVWGSVPVVVDPNVPSGVIGVGVHPNVRQSYQAAVDREKTFLIDDIAEMGDDLVARVLEEFDLTAGTRRHDPRITGISSPTLPSNPYDWVRSDRIHLDVDQAADAKEAHIIGIVDRLERGRDH